MKRGLLQPPRTNTPLLDLNADSASGVQVLGPVLSARFAQLPPSTEVAAAVGSPAFPSPDTLADPKLAFDYTHLGREGAEFFSAMITRELISAVPALRRYLIP